MPAAKQLTCLFVALLLLNLLFWLLPTRLMDSVIPYLLVIVVSALSVYFITADAAGVRVVMNRLDKFPRSTKILFCVGCFLALPGSYALLMYQIFR